MEYDFCGWAMIEETDIAIWYHIKDGKDSWNVFGRFDYGGVSGFKESSKNMLSFLKADAALPIVLIENEE